MTLLLSPILRRFAAAAALSGLWLVSHAAGFEHGDAAGPDGQRLEIGVWYPSASTPAAVAFGPTTMTVAMNAPIHGSALPLIVISHGTGGSLFGHADTAIALADAGYVVAALNHTGDNYRDQSRALYVMDRPLQVSRVIDHMLRTWPEHERIDPSRIGVFGFSAGGFTALVDIGGVPDFASIGPVCKAHPQDYACRLIAASDRPLPEPAATGAADRRIRAAVVAAPALGFAFGREGLKDVSVPVQLWRAEDDVVLPQPRYAEAVRAALPQAPDYHVVAHAGHFDFLMPCSAALAANVPDICTSEPGFDRAAFHQDFDRAVVKFFDRTLGQSH